MTTASLVAHVPTSRTASGPRPPTALHIAYFSVRGARITRTGGATDERLKQGVVVVHQLARALGKELGLGVPQAVQLSSGNRTLLVYAPGLNQLCGVLGNRNRVWPIMQRQGLDLEEGGTPRVPLRSPEGRSPLSGLDDIDGMLGGWIGVAKDSPHATTLPAHFRTDTLANATQHLQRLLQCSYQLGLTPIGTELLFAEHRLVVAPFSRGCVAALATRSANDRVLLGATRVLAERAEATCWLLPKFLDRSFATKS